MAIGYGDYTANAHNPLQNSNVLRAAMVPVRQCNSIKNLICVGNNNVGVEPVSYFIFTTS